MAHRAERLASGIKQSTSRKELQKLIGESPAQGLRVPPAETLLTQPFTREEVQKLLAVCEAAGGQKPPHLVKRAHTLALLFLLRMSDVARLKVRAETQSGHLTLSILKNGVRLKVQLSGSLVKALEALPVASAESFFATTPGTRPASLSSRSPSPRR